MLCLETYIFSQFFKYQYSKTCLKWPFSKRPKIGFQDQLPLNAGQKYCRLLQEEHSSIFSTLIKLPFVIKIFVLSVFEWPLKTGLTVPAEFVVQSNLTQLILFLQLSLEL